MSLFRFLFLGVHKISCPHEVWNLEKIINFHKGYAEIHIQRPFFDNKNST
jgi:hypothetical protein